MTQADKKVPFDLEEFKKAVARCGYTQLEICKGMGVSQGYFNHRAKMGSLKGTDAFWLASVGITPEMYTPNKPTASTATDVVTMRAAVRGAVTDAINARFSDEAFISSLRDIIRPVVRAVVQEELRKSEAAIVSEMKDMFE